ncbi:MAG: hypothetical protein PETM_01257 [Petrimonas sp.]|uniref:sugar-binding protein n=1 Tax=Petrimonas sp. TaxID=2023866 RepID=UPI0030CFBEB6
MRNVNFLVSLIVMFLSGEGCRLKQPDTFLIEYHTSEIQIDGDIDGMEWSRSTTLTDLYSPWAPAERDSTIFRCFFSQKYFNFCFEVIDRTLTVLEYTDEITVAKGDRVELFFSPSSKLSSYYCLEINPNGYILDYKAQLYRKFNYLWNFNHRDIVGKITSTGYVVEGRISLSELKKIDIDLDKVFCLGIFRADFTGENENSVIWYSWLNPHTKDPDFHIPSAFGKCKMKQP